MKKLKLRARASSACCFVPEYFTCSNHTNFELAAGFSRSSHRRCSVRKDVLKNFAKFTGKHLCQSLFFNEVAGFSLQPY